MVIKITSDTFAAKFITYLNNGEKEYFESMTEAAKESFVSPSLVSLAVKQGEIRGGYIWERDDIKI